MFKNRLCEYLHIYTIQRLQIHFSEVYLSGALPSSQSHSQTTIPDLLLWAGNETVYLLSPTGLRNDHEAVMVLIERRLHEIHAEARRKKSESGEEVGVAGGGASRQEAAPKGFVRVDSVLEGSPAATAVSARCSCYDPTPSEPCPFPLP